MPTVWVVQPGATLVDFGGHAYSVASDFELLALCSKYLVFRVTHVFSRLQGLTHSGTVPNSSPLARHILDDPMMRE